MKTFATILLALSVTILGYSQNIKTPQPSPGALVKQALGLSNVSIKYSRPGVKERKIFGELVPFGKVWRTGANQATTIKLGSDVTIEGKELKAGKYAIMTIPGENEWTVIFSNNLKVSQNSYKEEDDALRITAKPRAYSEKVETFTINFTDVKDDNLNVQFLWENTSVSFNVKTDVDAAVMKMIDKTMAGVSSGDYYKSAQYYYKTDKDINQAVIWIDKAVELDKENPKFWVIHAQAKIKAKAGDKKGAIAAAELSKKLAVEAKYDAYVVKNDELIKELSKKK